MHPMIILPVNRRRLFFTERLDFWETRRLSSRMARTFDDGKLISDWARESVSIMNSMKIMEGVSDTEFAPKGNYTVEQAIATMVRLYNCY